MNNTINKRWVTNRIKQGKILVKCDFHLTDDYSLDNANKFGKMDNFKLAYFGDYNTYREGQVKFYDDKFTCYGDKSGEFTIKVHSNLVFAAKLKE